MGCQRWSGRRRACMATLSLLVAGVFAIGVPARSAAAACRAAVAGPGMGLVPAAFKVDAEAVGRLASGQVRVTFVGHSSFFIETPAGASAFTDYNGYVRWPRLPDIVTMSNTHGSHNTDTVEAQIKFVLRGWNPRGGIAKNDMKFKDLRIRSIPTNITVFGGNPSNENSIFVFEVARLCLVHLGNLRHVLTRRELAELGQIDVLFAPIDGSSTLTYDELLQVIGQLGPRIVIPMHFGFGDYVDDFTAFAAKHFAVKRHGATTLLVSRQSLPRRTVVLFLAPN